MKFISGFEIPRDEYEEGKQYIVQPELMAVGSLYDFMVLKREKSDGKAIKLPSRIDSADHFRASLHIVKFTVELPDKVESQPDNAVILDCGMASGSLMPGGDIKEAYFKHQLDEIDNEFNHLVQQLSLVAS